METEKKPNPGPEQGLNKETVLERGKIEKIGGPIELEKVRNWTHNYRRMNDKDTTSHLFGRKVIEKLLAQKDCQGIRMHYCIDDTGKKQLVLSGVDHFGNNQLPREKQATKTENKTQLLPAIAGNDDYELVDQSWPCPGTQGCSSI
ncbi:hypothetical protein [Mucilaginibacter sp.]|uniref:hypothetical protein n=1 Tax=Mucilaginibacter sp. TaxID=1882438 RepID=UPI003B006CB5